MLRNLTSLIVVATSLIGCHPVPVQSGVSTWSIRRETKFVPAPSVSGSRLATDRVLKITEGDAEGLSALGGVKLGVLHAHVVDRIDPMSGASTESVVWPGVSIDAAALGATHARTISLEAPQPVPFNCGRRRSAGCEGAWMRTAVTATYELWHVDAERWAELPEGLRPKALPPSAIRDVQPGNWVRPPPVVDVRSD